MAVMALRSGGRRFYSPDGMVVRLVERRRELWSMRRPGSRGRRV